MKNLRIAKKNPSKILKIIDIHPATYRYVSNTQQNIPSIRAQHISFASNSKQHKNISSHRESSLKHSPSRSQRAIQVKTNSKNKKIRNRSLGSSQQAIKNQGVNAVLMRFRNSHEIHPNQEQSPYIRRPKLRESQKLLNFHSVSLADKIRKQQKGLKEKQSLKNVSKKRSTHLKMEHTQDLQNQQSYIIENAKALLEKGEHRKSLLLVKNILQNHPNHLQALYLSAVNWYHLQDRVKTIIFLQQIFQIDGSYSAQCYKMAAVCYSKTFQYNKSLVCLFNCHQYFPQEVQSYELQGKILSKINRWQEAVRCYQSGYDLSKNNSFLVNKALCHQELNQLSLALQCYERLTEAKQFDESVLLRKLKLNKKLYQFEEMANTYDSLFSKGKYSLKPSKQRDEIYYLISYAYYQLHKYPSALVAIDQGINNCINPVNFHKLLLMIRIHQRDIYEAIHLVDRIREMKQSVQIKIIMKFVQGVIELMRRNHQEGIDTLLTIQNDLGFKIQLNDNQQKGDKGKQTNDEFLNEIRSIYLMFLSYGYYSISQFSICRKLLKIQQLIGVPQYFQIGFLYNLQMCEGIIHHCDKDFVKAELHFLKASTMYDNKLEPPFSLALNCLQIMVSSNSIDQRKRLATKSNKYFQYCQKIVGKQTNNTAAGVYYFSSLLHGYMQEWRQALDCIDESIQRSEDHYWRYFYVRGLLLSCIHSFRQAINDLSLAIALAATTRPQCYLLRSKCLQIEGEGNEAFKDLQQYISLKPDDPEVHKFAGQLLFQNGAFEDALVAFSHQPISASAQNYDVFMTQGKNFFLLGRFGQAHALIKQAQQLKYFEEVEMDLHVIDILDSMVKKNQPVQQIDKRVQEVFTKYKTLGKIFKLSDYHLIKAICHIYKSSPEAAIPHFMDAIKQKSYQLGQGEDDENQSGIIQNKKDLQTFTNQMRYNVVLCRMLLDQRQEAISIYKTINVDFDQAFYGDYLNFKKFLNKEIEVYKKQDVFPSRNKLSNFLDRIQLTTQLKNQQQLKIALKLCIPFPKVQPPQIFPTFDSNLLARLSVLNVQRKPQAPWVLRENNSIKFTDKIDTFSNFELQDSENQSSSTYQMISIDQSHIDPSRLSKRLKTSAIKIVEQGKLSKHQH